MDEKNKLVDFWRWCWKPISPTTIFSSVMRPAVLVVVSIGLVAWYDFNPELAKFAGYLLGGILLLGQVWASSQRAKASEDTAKAMQQTADSTEKGNTTERFKNAIEHLGNESPSVRMGGIYALHHIAQDVEEYRKRVFEILCAHIRETTTQESYKPRKIPLGRTNNLVVSRPSIEIESILKLLFSDSPKRDIYTQLKANLEHSNLKRAALGSTSIQYANFFNANLNGVNFNKTKLQGTLFVNADLQNAHFEESNLKGAILISAELHGVRFEKTDLQYANFFNAKLQDTYFEEADLQGTIFLIANLQGADLSSAKNLTTDQLLETRTLYKAKLPDGMEAEIRQLKPELLEKPKLDNELEA